MDFNATVDLIIRDLDEAREIIDDFRNYPGVPVIQVELAKSKCKSAAEVIANLKNIQLPVSDMPRKESSPLLEEKPSKPAVKPEPKADNTAISMPPTVKNENKNILGNKVQDSTIIADTFSHLPGSLNEQLGSMREDEDVSDILKTQPLTDLSDAIGVNDKFLFIREIFRGNSGSYEQAITKLNNAENIKDAKAIILSYTGKYEETEASKQLLDLVKRKFPVDE
jgi:hypothetical protein